jgi:hypothetical protein
MRAARPGSLPRPRSPDPFGFGCRDGVIGAGSLGVFWAHEVRPIQADTARIHSISNSCYKSRTGLDIAPWLSDRWSRSSGEVVELVARPPFHSQWPRTPREQENVRRPRWSRTPHDRRLSRVESSTRPGLANSGRRCLRVLATFGSLALPTTRHGGWLSRHYEGSRCQHLAFAARLQAFGQGIPKPDR